MAEKKRVYPKEFLEYVQSITNKRAKVVIDHILAYGFITTADLENTYGYNHPPRAARDVREAGIPHERRSCYFFRFVLSAITCLINSGSSILLLSAIIFKAS